MGMFFGKHSSSFNATFISRFMSVGASALHFVDKGCCCDGMALGGFDGALGFGLGALVGVGGSGGSAAGVVNEHIGKRFPVSCTSPSGAVMNCSSF